MTAVFLGQSNSLSCENVISTCYKNNTGTDYCYQTRSAVYACDRWPHAEWCNDVDNKEIRFCPVNRLGLCEATFERAVEVWFRISADTFCPNRKEKAGIFVFSFFLFSFCFSVFFSLVLLFCCFVFIFIFCFCFSVLFSLV